MAERAREHLRAEGFAERCQVLGGSFFESVPAGADAYLLKHVIHDWNDERAAAILKNVRAAVPSDGKLVIVEGVYPPRIDQSLESRGAAANDVNMLVCTGGSHRRPPRTVIRGGCPPHPLTILDGLLRLVGRLEGARSEVRRAPGDPRPAG